MAEFKNPSQGGGGQDNRSFLVMIVVMIGVIVGLQYWRGQNAPPTPPAASAPATPTQSTAPALLPSPAAPAASSSTSSPAAASNIPTVQASAESTTVVENELYKITFSNRGAQVISWVIKRCGGGNPQPLCTDNNGQPLDLVHAAAAKLYGYPLSLYTYDANLRQGLANALYVPSATGTLESPATLNYNYSAGGYVVRKTFTFGSDYVIHADTQVTLNGAPVRALLAWPSAFGDMESSQSFGAEQLDISTGGKDDHSAPKKVTGGATTTEPLDFAGISDQYFAAIFIPDQAQNASLVTLNNVVDVKSPSSGVVISTKEGQPPANPTPKGFLPLPILGAAVGDTSGHNQLRLFVGPKALPVLQSISTADGKNLGPVLDFGFWGYIAKFLYYGLHFVQEHFARNWGWAIILFTILINLVVTPLRIQGMRSALKMQRIQPQIEAIKAKYKNPGPTDPKAADMNAEVMAYQKSQGVSMFGGCIPSLIQMPLLIAFFYMMNKVVELRHAHWFYLHDLASPDPYHILPLLMFATSFIAQYYTPSPGVDPQQQKMMAFMMPMFSAYMTWNYASALGLYWNVGNFIMIIQQQVMNQTSMGREMRELQRKRALAKTKGVQPKTIAARR